MRVTSWVFEFVDMAGSGRRDDTCHCGGPPRRAKRKQFSDEADGGKDRGVAVIEKQ